MSITIVKLGGSIITDKNVPFSINNDVIDTLLSQISEFYRENKRKNRKKENKILIVHGGGSFGHPVAAQYQIHKGINPQIDNQNLGMAKTHKVMQDLNKIIIEKLLNNSIPAMSIDPVGMFTFSKSGLEFNGANQIKNLLANNIIPVLFGDLLLYSTTDLDKSNNFSILSGDIIIRSIVDSLHSSIKIDKVIFTFNKDGIVDQSNNLIEKIDKNKLDLLNFSENIILGTNESNSIDVTGGMKLKLEEINKISKYGVNVYIINGKSENRLLKLLKGEPVSGTLIS